MTGAEQRITLPERLGPAQLRALRSDIEALEPAPVIIIGATTEVFCEGLALGELGETSPGEREAGLHDFSAVLRALGCAPCPIVAVVQGRALGGGLGIAAACDLVIASREARIGLPEPLFGMIPGLITPVLARRAGGQAIRRLALSGESVDAESAMALGFVDMVVPSERLDTTVASAIRRFRRTYPPAVGRLKKWMWEMDGLDKTIAQGRQHMLELFVDPEVLRRTARFAAGFSPWDEEGSR